MNVILFGKKNKIKESSRNVIKLRILKLVDPGLSEWTLNVIPCIFIATGRGRLEHTQGRKQCKELGREFMVHSLNAGMMQPQLRNSSSHRGKLEESKLPQSPSMYHDPFDIDFNPVKWILDFRNCERMNFC